VKDEAGRPIAGVTVEALFDHGDPARAVTGADGRYTLRAAVGVMILAQQTAGRSRYAAYEVVSEADGDEETIDLRLVDATSPEAPADDEDEAETPAEAQPESPAEAEALPGDE
jgi:hypothetical protein